MNRAIEPLYAQLAPLYDVIYGGALQHGRGRAMERLAPRAGESILEVGVGTGISAVHYPRECRVTAIDLSAAMLDRARTRIVRHGTTHVRLCRMDAARLAFREAQFDAVYAPYVLNVVPDPVGVAREMLRVCRPHGRIVLLNHFNHAATRNIVNSVVGWMAGLVSDVNWNLDLDRLLHEAGLVAIDVEPVNVPRVSSVVLCRAG
jgi:phosphatidylethanolamine/phosphatidyl-N-methylethanolamine N-methyltransferase